MITIFLFCASALHDYSPNLSILFSEGNENNYDSVSNGERTPTSPYVLVNIPGSITCVEMNGLRMDRLFYKRNRVKVP